MYCGQNKDGMLADGKDIAHFIGLARACKRRTFNRGDDVMNNADPDVVDRKYSRVSCYDVSVGRT